MASTEKESSVGVHNKEDLSVAKESPRVLEEKAAQTDSVELGKTHKGPKEKASTSEHKAAPDNKRETWKCKPEEPGGGPIKRGR